MKQIILFFLFVVLFASCKEKINSVADIMNALTPEAQSSSIDPSVDNIVKGKKGTQIFIPANALRFKDGTIPTGKVKIELQEFFSTSDFISNNLSTVSDSFLLETNGMLYISATADGKELVVDNSKSYSIAFPKNDSTKQMELFYGDTMKNGTVNWQTAMPTGEGFSFGYDSTLIDSSLYQEKVRVCGSLWYGNQDWYLALDHPDSNIYDFIYKNFTLPDSLYKELCELENYFEINFFIDDKGHGHNFSFETKTSAELRKALTSYMESLPLFDVKKYRVYTDLKYSFTLCCHKEFNQEEYSQRFKQKYTRYQDRAIEKMEKGELGIYIFNATKFGWINCDRFYLDNREKIDFLVKAPSADAKGFIVFDEINSIMTGTLENGSFIFPNVPVDSKVRIIVISFENGKPSMATEQNKVSKKSVSLSNFKSFSITELEKQLNKSS